MGLFVRQEEDQSALRTKVTAELQERMKKTAQVEGDDVSTNSTALQNQHTTKKAGVIITIVLVLLVAFVLFLLRP